MRQQRVSHTDIEDNAPLAFSPPDSKLPQKAIKLLAHIIKICRTSPDHSCFKSIKNIAADCGLALQTAHNHKHLLYARGFIRIEERSNGKRSNPRHRITLIPEKLEPRQSTPSRPAGRVRARGRGRHSVTATPSRVRLAALSLWKEFDRLDLISQYFRSGWQVCPGHHPIFDDGITSCSCRAGRKCSKVGKHPKLSISGWERRFKEKHDDLIEYFFQNPADNVGVWLPDGLMVVDFDDLQAKEEIFGDTLPKTLVCTTPRGLHLYFLAHELFRTTASCIKANVDIRAPGSWVILPPSIHKTGFKYEWENLASPTSVPATLVELLRNTVSQESTGERKALSDKNQRTSSFTLPDVIYNPKVKRSDQSWETFGLGRNAHLFAYGRSLRARGNEYRTIHAALHQANDERCIPPIDSEEMKKLIDNVWNLRDDPKWLPRVSR